MNFSRVASGNEAKKKSPSVLLQSLAPVQDTSRTLETHHDATEIVIVPTVYLFQLQYQSYDRRKEWVGCLKPSD